MRARVAAGLFSLAVLAPGQILFDTDSGIFGDDGVALVMLMRSPRGKDIRGVSVVSGNVWASPGAGYMRRTLKLLGRENVPVRIGALRPLVHTPAMVAKEGAIEFSGALGLPAPPLAPSTAVEAMAHEIEAAPGKVTIFAIGPMTNVALLLSLRPDLETKIAALVFMGGNVHVGGNASKTAEFNFWFDPDAARIVLRSAIPKKVMFGLDVSNRIQLTNATFERVVAVKTPITDLYREDFGNRYPGFLKNPKAEGSLWDELAAAYLIDPSLVTRSETAFLDVDATFGPRYGAAVPLDRSLVPTATPVEVVLDMDFRRVLELYVKALTTR